MTSHQVNPDFVPGVTEGGPVFHADCEPGGVLVTLGRKRSNSELWFEVRIENVGAIYLPVVAIQGMLDDAGLIPDNHRSGDKPVTDMPQIPSMFTPQAAVVAAIEQLVDVSNALGLLVTLVRRYPEKLDDARTYGLRVEEALAHCHEATRALRTLLPAKPE